MYCISYVFSNHFYPFVFIALIAYVGHPWRCNVAKHSFWMQQCVSLHVSCMSPYITPSAKLFLQWHCHIHIVPGLWTAICLDKIPSLALTFLSCSCFIYFHYVSAFHLEVGKKGFCLSLLGLQHL